MVGAVFQTDRRPPVLRVDIRNPRTNTGVEDCERMSRALEAALDREDVIPDAYVLEVSSPGVSSKLTDDRDFIAFRGFDVLVRTSEAGRQKEMQGKLVRRDEKAVYLNLKGRTIAIERACVSEVRLVSPEGG